MAGMRSGRGMGDKAGRSAPKSPKTPNMSGRTAKSNAQAGGRHVKSRAKFSG
jgi:hypothetical protein